MCAAATTDTAVDRKQLTLWLDDYRDGVIDEDSARCLAKVILSGTEDAAWVVEELSFSGLLAQSLHDVDEESFVRAFVERLSAERGSERVNRVVSGSTARFRAMQQQRKVTWLQAATESVFARGGQTGTAPQGEPYRLRLALIALGVVVGLSAILLAGRQFLTPATVARLLAVTPGVVIHRDGARLLPEVSMRLWVGDAVRVPRGGRADLGLTADVSVVVVNDAAISLRESETGGDVAEVELLAGEIEATVRSGGDALLVETLHARVRCRQGGVRLSATSASTRVECLSGEILVVRRSDGETVTVPADSSVIVVPGMPLRLASQQ